MKLNSLALGITALITPIISMAAYEPIVISNNQIDENSYEKIEYYDNERYGTGLLTTTTSYYDYSLSEQSGLVVTAYIANSQDEIHSKTFYPYKNNTFSFKVTKYRSGAFGTYNYKFNSNIFSDKGIHLYNDAIFFGEYTYLHEYYNRDYTGTRIEENTLTYFNFYTIEPLDNSGYFPFDSYMNNPKKIIFSSIDPMQNILSNGYSYFDFGQQNDDGLIYSDNQFLIDLSCPNEPEGTHGCHYDYSSSLYTSEIPLPTTALLFGASLISLIRFKI